MTTFICENSHEFRLPFVRLVNERHEYYCPVCTSTSFHVVELGGEPSEADPCEGACTL